MSKLNDDQATGRRHKMPRPTHATTPEIWNRKGDDPTEERRRMRLAVRCARRLVRRSSNVKQAAMVAANRYNCSVLAVLGKLITNPDTIRETNE